MAGLDEASDEELMTLVQEGSHPAFAALVRRHTSRFYAAAYRMCSDADAAEDIVQDAFLKLWDKPQIWDASRGAKFSTWFYRVVTNLAIDHTRRRKPGAHPDVLEIVADERAGPERGLAEKQEQANLEAAIQDLPERQRAALNLCFYEGLSNREAAEILGVKVKALESLLVRAKAGIRDSLIRRGALGGKREERRNYAGRI